MTLADAIAQTKDLEIAIRFYLSPFICKTPGYGVPGQEHCAACCYGTGFAVTSQQESDLCADLDRAASALSRYATALQREAPPLDTD